MKPEDERPNPRMADTLTALRKRGGQATRRKSNEVSRRGEDVREGVTTKKTSGTLQRQVSAIAKKVNGKQVAGAAAAEKQAAATRRRARRIKRLKASCENPACTPVTSYNRGCRCKACVTAHSDYYGSIHAGAPRAGSAEFRKP
jgi:hypothetical protein